MLVRIAFVSSFLISVIGAGAAGAATYIYDFSWTNKTENDGLVQGVLYVRDGTGPARGVHIDKARFGAGNYTDLGILNSFTVVDGELTDFLFVSERETCCTFGMRGSVGGKIEAGLYKRGGPMTWVNAPDFTFTPIRFSQPPDPVPASVPLPAPLLMLLAGLGGLGLVGRFRRAAPAAT